MEIGIKNVVRLKVDDTNTAAALGSGTLAVFATPAMVALIEETAWKSVEPYLADGQGSVGTKIDVSHVAPTPVGMEVICKTELVGIDGRCLKFKAEISDDKGLIGTAVHERFIISSDKFLAKANAKLQ